MSKTKKIVIAIVIIIIIAAAIAMYVRFSQAFSEPEGGPAVNYNIIAETTAVSTETIPVIEPVEVTTGHIYTDEDFAVDTDFLFTPYGEFDDKDRTHDGLVGDVSRFDMSALTVKFDNIEFMPGMYVRDIIDNSYWYTSRENDIIKAGGAGFVCIDNDYWTSDEIKLNKDKSVTNGNVILWFHNYSDTDAALRDCMIYKYQISYLGCWDIYTEHPSLEYRDWTFGSEVFATASSINGVTLDNGFCIRYTYGDLSECQVLLDADDNGLIGITVIYNEYYGPDFNKGGDNDG